MNTLVLFTRRVGHHGYQMYLHLCQVMVLYEFGTAPYLINVLVGLMSDLVKFFPVPGTSIMKMSCVQVELIQL